jgi:hypothetical protein
MAEIIFSRIQQKTLPFTTTYTPNIDSEIVLMLSGSAWTSRVNCKIGLVLEIDGVEICSAEIFSNGPTTHRLLIPGIVSHTFKINYKDSSPEPVNITVKALNGDTLFDQNDYISLTIV